MTTDRIEDVKACFDLNFKVINFVTFGSFEPSSLHLYAIVNVLHFTSLLFINTFAKSSMKCLLLCFGDAIFIIH